MMILKIKSGTKIWIENLYHQELQTLLQSLKLDYLLEDNYLTIPQGNIGKIVTKNLEIIIEPSIKYLKAVDYLRLIITDKLAQSKNNILGFEKDNNIEKFVINQFIENLTKLLKQGIPPQYKHQEIESKYLQGNLNLYDSYLRIKLEIEPPFITSIQKMEIDYFVMRVIKQAYQKLILNFPSYQKPEITKILRYVSNESVSIEKLKTTKFLFNKQEKYLGTCFEFACLILQNMSAKKLGINVSFSLIINSNILFERYILNFLQQKFSQDTFKYKKSIIIADSSIDNKTIKIEPDIIYQGSRDVIIDVKNKNFDKAILNSDFYQIYTYCKALNTDTGILIYPYYQSAKPIIINPNFDDKIRVYILAIDITKSLDIDMKQAQNRFLENIKDIIMYG